MNFPVNLQLGPIQIHPHFFFEALGYTIAFQLLLRQVRRDSIAPTQRSSVVVGGMLGALIGAKVLVLLQHIDVVWQNWQLGFLLLIQGKTIVGGLLGGLIGVEITKKMIGVNRSTGDIFVYPLIVGIAVGRIGCFLIGLSDRTYGVATNLPWGIDFGDGITRHPTQLYEIIFLLSLMIFLSVRSQYQKREGDLFKFFMVAYLGFRFLVDFIKPDFDLFFGLTAIQLACLFGLFYYRSSIINLKDYANSTLLISRFNK